MGIEWFLERVGCFLAFLNVHITVACSPNTYKFFFFYVKKREIDKSGSENGEP